MARRSLKPRLISTLVLRIRARIGAACLGDPCHPEGPIEHHGGPLGLFGARRGLLGALGFGRCSVNVSPIHSTSSGLEPGQSELG